MTEHGIELMGLSMFQETDIMHFHAQILMVTLFVKPHCSFLMSYGPIQLLSLLYLTASPCTPDQSCTATTYHVPSNPSTVLQRAKTTSVTGQPLICKALGQFHEKLHLTWRQLLVRPVACRHRYLHKVPGRYKDHHVCYTAP